MDDEITHHSDDSNDNKTDGSLSANAGGTGGAGDSTKTSTLSDSSEWGENHTSPCSWIMPQPTGRVQESSEQINRNSVLLRTSEEANSPEEAKGSDEWLCMLMAHAVSELCNRWNISDLARFECNNWGGPDTFCMTDMVTNDSMFYYRFQLENPNFDVVLAWDIQYKADHELEIFEEDDLPVPMLCEDSDNEDAPVGLFHFVEELCAFAAKVKQVPEGHFAPLQRNTAKPRDFTCLIPKPIVIVAKINGQPVHALLDLGLLGDFMLSALADQLRVVRIVLEQPLPVQLAMQGSQSKINNSTEVQFEYARINKKCYFDIANVDGYDLILGTLFLFQHQMVLGFNDTRVVVGSDPSLPMKGEQVMKLTSQAVKIKDNVLEAMRIQLHKYARPLCQKAKEALLLPFRKINHQILIIDKEKVYPYHPSKLPEAFCPLWEKKKDTYLQTGWWRLALGCNAAPLMFLPKLNAQGELCDMQNTANVHNCNANTEKLASPVPDQRGIFQRVLLHKYHSGADAKGTYNQVQVEPGNVKYNVIATPDGTMESLVMLQGNCNAVATFCMIMMDMFAPFLGVWMDIYLDDIIVYMDTLEEHVQRIEQVIDILLKNKFYLAADKLQILPEQLHLLGHVIMRNGLLLDPEKVDSVTAWKMPTNRDLL